MNLAEDICDIIENTEAFEYVNRHGVTIEAEDEENFSANAVLLEYLSENGVSNSVAVELFCERASFIKLLQIQSAGDIEHITKGQLMELYLDGKAEIVCFAEVNFSSCMVFSKQGTALIAKNEKNHEHKVMIKLETATDFIHYTQQYYKLVENYSEN